jgi:hypothetical protein
MKEPSQPLRQGQLATTAKTSARHRLALRNLHSPKTFLPPSPKAEEGQDRQNNHHKSDQIDETVHDQPPEKNCSE